MDTTRKDQIYTLPSTSLSFGGRVFIPQQPITPEPQDRSIKSYLGTPIYSSLDFKAVTDSDDVNLPSDVREITQEDLQLTEILMTVQQSKNIVKTALNGRPGTVKEYISDGDYAITVEGMIVGEVPNVFPEDAVKRLTTFLDLPQSLEVGSRLLTLFGITKIVVNDYNFFEIEGTRNQVAFRLMMWSDTDFKIEPTENAVT